jgi:hypothetical protein
MFSCQGWSLVMPEGVTRVGHLLLLSEEEFLASLLDAARHGVGRICYRAAVKTCAPVVATAPGPGSVPAAGVSFNNAPSQTRTFTPTFTPNINIIMPAQGVGSVPVSHAKAVPKSSREEERPADGQKKQTNIAALFGKAPPSFTGLSDKQVLQAVKWAPIESGGHTAGSKLSVFRNKFMADFVRQNPSRVFDKETEKDIRAQSLTAYEARGTEVVVESEDISSGLWYVGPEKDPEQLVGGAQVEGDNEADGLRENESANSETKAPKKHEREVDVEEDRTRKAAKLPQEPVPTLGSIQMPEEAISEGDQKPQKAEVEKVQGEKRPLVIDDVGSGSSEIDLVQEAVNPDGKSFTVPHLKVTFIFCCFYSAQLSRRGCARRVLPLGAISPN